jgi:release factor glutamine methyltransferase
MSDTVTIRDVLVDAQRRFSSAGIASPDVDAAEIVAFVLGCERNRLFMHEPMESDARVRVERLVTRRLSRVPLQHILGTAGFRRMNVRVGPGVFIPRPETELVVEAAIRHVKAESDRTAVDLCSGSGAIALAIATEVDGVRVVGVEVSAEALVWADVNHVAATDLLTQQQSEVTFIEADGRTVADPGEPLADMAGRVAVVTCNPPYIPDAMVPREPEVREHEPALALFGGPDGMDLVRPLAETAARLLRPGGLLVMEHADVQGEDAGGLGVPGILRAAMSDAHEPLWRDVRDRTDLAGRPRFTMAVRAR